MKQANNIDHLTDEDISRIVEMAWEDRTPFEAIFHQFHLRESEVIRLMRRTLKRSSWELWRERVAGRTTKHAQKRAPGLYRFKSPNQR